MKTLEELKQTLICLSDNPPRTAVWERYGNSENRSAPLFGATEAVGNT